MSLTTPDDENSRLGRLELLSTECMHLVVDLLDFYDIMALELVGNRTLSSKLANAVTDINAQILPLSKWTHLPFRYRKLRSLCLNSEESDPNYTTYAPNDLLIPLEGHKSLQVLRIGSPLALTLLQSNSPIGSLTLSALLPSLRTLAISTEGLLTRAVLLNVPSTVTNLTLRLSDKPISADVLEDLPKSLEKLLISNRVTCKRDEHGVKPILLPASLNQLVMTLSDPIAILGSLPHTMEQLTVYGGNSEVLNLKISQFSPKIQRLGLWTSQSTVSLTMDAILPATLTSFSISSPTEFLDPTTGLPLNSVKDYFPPSVKEFYLPDAIREHYLPHPSLPSLEEMSDCADPLVWRKMTNLTALAIPSTVESSSLLSLPMTLTDLTSPITSNSTVWLEVLPKLVHLKRLSIFDSDHSAPSGFWDCLYTRLEALSCRTSDFETHKALSDGGWTKLIRLSLQFDTPWPGLDAYADASKCTIADLKDHPLRYPSTLEALTIIGSTYLRMLWPPIADLKRLKTLVLYGTPRIRDTSTLVENQGIYEFMTCLSPRLSYMCIHLPHQIDPKYLWNLPRSLHFLVLGLGGGTTNLDFVPGIDRSLPYLHQHQNRYLWTEEHIRSLPHKLIELNLQGLRMFDLTKFDGEISLPPTLATCYVPPAHPAFETEIIKESKRQHALSHVQE